MMVYGCENPLLGLASLCSAKHLARISPANLYLFAMHVAVWIATARARAAAEISDISG